MMRNNNELRPYQLEMIGKIEEVPRLGLFLEMGLGKTVITLNAISNLLKCGNTIKVLIIAPLRVANTVWKQEMGNWNSLTWMTNHTNICTGSPENRLKALSETHKILIASKDNLEWLMSNKIFKYDMIVIDESSAFKSPKTKRFKSILREVVNAKRIVILSGTPSANSLLDLWSQLWLLDQGKRLGKDFYAFRRKYWIISEYSYRITMMPGTATIIHDKISDICISMKAKDYIDLPDKIEKIEYVEMDIKTRKIYKDIERDLICEINSEEYSATNAAHKVNKLLQICNGFIYNDEHKATILHGNKLDVIEEIMNENPNENLLIAYNYNQDLELLTKKFPFAKVIDKDGKIIDDWNAGKIKMLLVHPMSAGHGLNLQFGGHTIIWYGLTWSLEAYQQLNARLYRSGQKNTVTVIHILNKETVEDRVIKALEHKNITQESLLSALKFLYKETNNVNASTNPI